MNCFTSTIYNPGKLIPLLWSHQMMKFSWYLTKTLVIKYSTRYFQITIAYSILLHNRRDFLISLLAKTISIHDIELLDCDEHSRLFRPINRQNIEEKSVHKTVCVLNKIALWAEEKQFWFKLWKRGQMSEYMQKTQLGRKKCIKILVRH